MISSSSCPVASSKRRNSSWAAAIRRVRRRSATSTEDRFVTTAGSYAGTALQNSNALGHAACRVPKRHGGRRDSTPPSVPTGLTATPSRPLRSTRGTASTDNVGVTGYRVFRERDSRSRRSPTTAPATPASRPRRPNVHGKSIDAAGNASGPSSAIATTLPRSDTTPPTATITAPLGTHARGHGDVTPPPPTTSAWPACSSSSTARTSAPRTRRPYSISWDTTAARTARTA